MSKEISFKQIGVIHSPFTEPAGTPIQPPGADGAKGSVELFPEYAEGLEDLEGFSHIFLIYYFHKSGGGRPLRFIPFLDDNYHGVFAMRGPSRPNRIGLSVVALGSIEDNVLHVRDVDILDGTPLLDIKPYVPQFDARKNVKIGWLKTKVEKLEGASDDGRFAE